MARFESLRSLLFVPVTQQRFNEGAPRRGADAIILNLEDAVAPAEKATARELLRPAAQFLSAAGQVVLARVNNTPDLLAHDLRASVEAGVAGIFIPKVDGSVQVLQAAETVHADAVHGPAELPAIIPMESPLGLLHAYTLAHSAVAALAFGGEDFAAAMGTSSSEEALRHPAQEVAIQARAAGKPAFGLPGPIAQYADAERFAALARTARAIGMAGAMAVHPSQVPLLNAAFQPSAEELGQAEAVKAAFEEALARGAGATSLAGGEMIDRQIYDRAVAVLAPARR